MGDGWESASPEIRALAASLMPRTRQPNFRYFKNSKGVMFCWTTEPMENGKFACWTYQPYGKGARSGKPGRWKMINRVDFAKRRVAKARAYSRYQKSESKEVAQ